MLTALWSGIGDKAADRWAALLQSPALAFWLLGLLAWVWRHGGLWGPGSGWTDLVHAWDSALGGSGLVAQAVAVGVGLLIVSGCDQLGRLLTLPVLRLLEGYWPRWLDPLAARRIERRSERIKDDAEAWRTLFARRDALNAQEYAQLLRLEQRRAAVPTRAAERMPTALGDRLRVMESRPRLRYGLDAVTTWPRLWLLLPDTARTGASAAREGLDEAARWWAWSLLSLVWVALAWWVLPIAVLGLVVAYRWALMAAAAYAVVVQSCFDLHRDLLYTALGVPPADDPAGEREAGARVTRFLQRGAAGS